MPFPPQPPEVQGLVLSGGGSRASFHIGALRYLYDRVHIAPTCIVGTSAGSIVGTMLSQWTDGQKQAKGLDELERIWMSMTGPSDMFVEQAWFSRLRGQWDDLSDLISQHVVHDVPEESIVESTTDGTPVEVVMRAMTEDPSQDLTVTPSILWQLVGSLARLGRASAGLASTVRGAERAASAYRPGPIVKRMLFESTFKSSRVTNSGVRLRIAFVDLNSGNLRFMREDGVIVDREDNPVNDEQFDVTLGVWASCALPGIFRPVKLGSGVYVDGGVRENVPVEMAVTHLGVTKPYVIVAGPPYNEPGDYTNKDAVALMLRVANLVLDENIQDEVEWARSAGACVIQPRVDVHSSLTVDPVLLSINRDYGWIRAAEEVTGAPKEIQEIDDALISARCQWAALVKQPDARGKKTALNALHRKVRDLLATADPDLLPPDHALWATHLV